MASVQDRPTPSGLLALLSKVLSNSGFQRAHIMGRSNSGSGRGFSHGQRPGEAREAGIIGYTPWTRQLIDNAT